MSQRLLHERRLAHLHRHRSDDRMAVIRRADSYRVDVLTDFVQHLAEVVIFLRFGPADGREIQALVIDVANRHDVAEFARLLRIARSLATDANAAEANALVGRPALARRDAAQSPIAGSDYCRGLQKSATIWFSCHIGAPGE